MNKFIFDLQRFADVTIAVGESYTLDGVTYTAITDAVLNLDSDNKVSGIASGKVTAVVAGLENSPTATFDATDGELNFTASGVDGAFVITGIGFVGYTLSSGSVTMSAAEFEGNAGVQKLSFTKDSSISLVKDGRAINVVFKEDSAFYRWISDENIIYCKLDGDSADFDVSLALNGKEIIGNTVTFGGRISYSPAQGTIALINDGKNPDTKDSFASFNLGNYKFQMATDGKTVVAGLKVADDGTISINYPLEAYNETHLTISNGDTPIFDGNLEVLSGSFLLSENGALTITKDTELQIDFGGGYVVKFTTTDDAGGSISLGADGITFKPNTDDGHLELSVTRGDETRTASLEMTGSLIYKLDGSISLAKDTVVKNVFEDGNILTITANTDASGSIIFTPQNGLQITPATPEALNIKLTTGDVEVANISSISGTINYKGGLFTASDGAEVNVLYYNGEYNINIKNTGNSSLIQFDSDRVIGTANEGATLVLNYLNGPTWNIHSKTTLTKIYDAEAILSEGANFDTNDSISVFTLGTVGNYTLNGISVTTTKDNVPVLLSDYNTVKFGEDAQTNLATSISGNDLTVTASTKEGQGSVTVDDDGNITYDATGGTLQISVPLEDVIGDSLLPNDFTISGGSITVGATNADATKNISITKGTALSFTKNGMTFDTVVQNDINGRLWMREGHVIYLHSYEDANFDTTIIFADKEIFKGMITLSGAFAYNAATGSTGPVDSNTYNVHDSYIQVALGNQSLKLTTNGDTFFAILNVDDNGKITFDFNNEKYNSMRLTLSTGDTDVLSGTLRVTGSIGFNPATQEISFTKGTKTAFTLGNYTFEFTATDDISSKVAIDAEGNFILTPGENDGSLNVVLKKGDTPLFGGNLAVSGGSIGFNPATQALSFTKGTKTAFTLGNYTFEFTATDDISSKFAMDAEGNFIFTPGENDGSLNVVLKKGDTPLFGGNLAVSGGSIGFNPATQEISFTKGTKTAFTLGNYTFEFTATDDISSKFAMDAEGNFIFTPGENDGSLNVVLKKGDTPILGGNLTVSDGSIGFNLATQALSFTKGTKTAFTLGNYTFEFTATDDINSKVAIDAEGNFILTPGENDGSLDITIKRGDTPIFSNNVSVVGKISFNPTTQSLGLADGTKISTAFGDYEVTAIADGDAAVTFAMTSAGFSITPVKGDGTLNLKLGSESGSLSANLEVLSGSFILGENGTLTVTKDTELQIDFGGGYIVKFKTTDDAGGSISLGTDGITFTPTEGDGHLELSVTRDGETRTTSLEMTGSLTYKLDGSISLAKDTVVKNIFEDGNELTITANTDASGSIVFNSQNGLTITPAMPDALNVVLTTDEVDIVNISSITGTINYSGGIVTASDGTSIVVDVHGGYHTSLKTTGGTTSVQFGTDRTAYTANEGAMIVLDYLDGTTWDLYNGSTLTDVFDGAAILSAGSTFNSNDDEIYFVLDKAGNYTINGMKVTTTKDNVLVVLSDYDTIIVDGISYTPLDDNVTLTIGENGATVADGKVTMQMEGFDIALSEDVTDGSISYNGTTGKFTVKAGTKSYLGEGKFPDQFVAKNDFDISVTKTDDGKFKFSLGDESIAFDLTRNGKAIMGSTITLDGSIIVDPTNNEISLPKDTVITMTPDMGKILQITALDDAGGELTLVDGGLRFKPNENDGALEFNFVDAERKATLDVTGAFTYKGLGALSLEDGTVANLTWTDGTELKITSSGSTGSIGIDPDKGIKITSDDENLDMTLTTPYMSTDISGIKGTIYYKEGNVSFDENSKIIATTTLGGQPILTTLETIDGTGHISFSGTTNGIVYSADTGAMKITWSRDDLESTFVVNKGSIQIGHNLFRIAEGSDIATDLKTFVPALYFTTAEAGTYTINGQKITTSAEGLALTATDDQMVFKTSGDVVEYNGMTFAGNGNVSLKADNVVLGEGVEATGFSEDKSFVLAEAGNVTADAKVFELSKIEGTPREIPMIITVTGAQDGFVFSRTLTKESEAYLDDALDDEKFENYSSSYIGQVFTEKFISAGDSSYRIRTDAIGLEEVIGISDGATITGGASLADEPTLSYYNLVTDTTGKFTIGERTYNVSGDSSIALRARFEEDAAPYASMVDSLDGTISGDFSGGQFSINGSSALKIINDTDISIVADENGYEILGLDAGANLQVEAADTYKVNGTEIAAGASSVIVGTADGKASLYTLPAALADFMLHKTEAGYPQMAVLAFHPDEEDPDPPTNYHSAEKWTTASKDDLQLSAIHYSPENPTGKWVILVHGYGKKGAAMNALAEPYLAQGLDVLIVDQRTAGASEGDWLTMGVAEANDLAIWTQEIAKTNANAQITLHGVSMGAATVMLCAALPETTNLSAMIEDCGYGNIADVFATLLTYYGRSLGVGDVDYYELFDEVAAVAKTFDGGYDVTDAAPIESIAAVTVPSLFIHGAADAVIPSTNADALYEASGASNKTKLIIEGAGHAQSIVIDTEAYLAAVKKLIDSSTTEIGALIDSDSDSKVLRGTIYNDTITNSGHSVTIEALDGDDFITNNVDSSVTAAEFGNLIDMGDGNDTVYNHHSYNPTLLGGAGNDSIVISRGHKTFADGGEGNDSIIGRLADNPDSDWAIGGHATVLGSEGNDYISTGYTNDSSIDGGSGDDTIITCGLNNTIDGGDGKNLINMNVVDREDLSEGSFIVLNGQTTVEGFATGFGEGTDTVYIKGESPAVDFKADGLTLYYDDDKTKSLTFAGLSTTDKLNLYYEQSLKSVAEVFIADDEWYSVTEDDLSVRDDSELWFVGATAKKNHGIDFSGISDALNITLNTDYEADVENFRINNIHSLKGGAGLTTITGSDKDDTIIAGKGKTTIDGGDGKNLIDLTDSSAAQIVLNGNTTVKGFATGFGEGSDTIYIDGDPAGVDFKDGVLTFSNATDSLTLSDVTTTAKVNIYHERREVLNKGVFIAADDWYKVEDSDLTVNAGEEVYFVGTSADPKTGVDFSGITQDLNVTIDTAYIDSEDYVPTTMWINGVYSLKGGAGNTTITGSDKNDTIIAGTGATTINASEGNDFIRLGSANALVEYSSGDGNDIIEGFRADSTLSIASGKYSSATSGDDVVISVDDGKITLTGAASLSSINIEGKHSTITVEESIASITNGYVTNYYDYGTPITDQSKVKTLLEGDLNGDMALLLKNKSADFSDYSGKKNVTLMGGGNQSVTFNQEGHNTAIVDENTDGTKNISLGGGDLVFVENTKARVSITASKGEDSIFSAGENVTVNLDNGGNSWLFVTGGKMTLEGYDNTTGAGFNEPYDDIVSEIADKIANKEITFDDGNLSMGAAVVSFGDVTSEIVNFYNSQVLDELQKVGFASDNAAINTSSYKGNFILVGKKNSTLTAGKGDDTIFADEGSIVDAGSGNDHVENIGDSVQINGGADNDLLVNAGDFVTIDAGAGNDHVENIGDSVQINGGAGDDSIYNYSGDSVQINGGADNDSLGNAGDFVTIDAGAGNDRIENLGDSVQIDGGAGDDSIITYGSNNTLNGGDGKNLISLNEFDSEDPSEGSFVVLNGQTTVEGFKTGFGEGTDTVYIEGESPAVDFKADGLTLYYDDDNTKSLTFAGLSTTDKLNLYYAKDDKTVAEVFIADDEWYSVTADDLSVMNDRELLFVGATAKMDHGIDFSGITSDVNATLLGHNYPDYVENLWINNIHSIKGGAGNTTITGSDKSDTILAGTGATTINAAAGNDFVSLGSASALVEYSSGDGNDIIQGFRADSTLSIANGKYSSAVSGSDVIISVDSGTITLTGAARLSKVNIDGEKDNTGLTLTNSDDMKVTLGSTVKSADAFARTKPIVIVGNDLDNVIKGSKALDLIYGGNGDDSINSGLGNDKIWGCDGDDTLLGNAGNDYLEGGDGHDTIYGGSGTDTLKGDNGNDYLNGNEGNDKLYGGNGSDTLKGGKGNDSLWGNGGADTFIYTKDDGNDIIYGFDDTDMLQITGKFVAAYNADNNVISFNVGDTSDAITLKNFTASTFNVNGTAYKISGNTLVKK